MAALQGFAQAVELHQICAADAADGLAGDEHYVVVRLEATGTVKEGVGILYTKAFRVGRPILAAADSESASGRREAC